MTVHRLVRALVAVGMMDAVLDLFTNKEQPGWARLLDRGATFTWEAWDLADGTDYSQSHAWSASVVKEILECVLGVRYTAPGGNEVLIEPPLCRLEHAQGSVPVGNGYVRAGWRRLGQRVELECTIPPGVTATVRLPAGSYSVKGTGADAAKAASPPADGSGTHPAPRDFRVHAGTWTFTPA
jgi:alpha-L-rhamnosidase